MISNLTTYVDFLTTHGITANQFLLLQCLYLDRLEPKENGRAFREKAGAGRPIANLYRYVKSRADVGEKAWSHEDVDSLVEKGFIRNTNKKGEYFPDNLIVTDKFIDEVFAGRKEFHEFVDTYPDFTDAFDGGDRKIPLKMAAESVIWEAYRDNVGNQAEHSRMMRALEWAVKNKQISMKITNFLESKHWVSLERLMDEEGSLNQPRGAIA